MEPIFEDMTNNIMKGFQLLDNKGWRKYIDFNKIPKKGHYSGIRA